MKLEKIKQYVRSAVSTAGRLTIIAAAIIIGFGAAKFQEKIFSDSHGSNKMPPARSLDSTSIAVNERGELLLIDRKNGTFQIYSDTVGRAIFNVYAGQMYAKMNTK